jgi:hypothetical protein
VHARGRESKTCYIVAGRMMSAVEQLMGSRVAAAGGVKEGSAVNEGGRAHARCDAEIRIQALRCQKARTNVALGMHQ